ncbi:MAG TPA: hypothetical protein VL382_01655 [Terriglobales bacterium]|nr:hypothetical protein [Terriglobales bacterium]
MELRKDPITRSWVITGDEPAETPRPNGCPFCAGANPAPQVISSAGTAEGFSWGSSAVVHPSPLYRIEGDPARRGDGLYDKMRAVGAHEVLVENPRHDRQIWVAPTAEVENLMLLIAQRIQDLKRDRRFKYITVFKNHGRVAGQEFEHPTFQLTASTFVPRRVLYELRSGREYYAQKERCVFCDILAQEERQAVRLVESIGDYVACCPYAPRVPYETWIVPRSHEASFERGVLARRHSLGEIASLLQRTLRRIRAFTEDFHLVLHTTPNTMHKSDVLEYWRTIDDDYHWHIEILPILASKPKSYTFKEVYYTPVTSETAAARLRDASVG